MRITKRLVWVVCRSLSSNPASLTVTDNDAKNDGGQRLLRQSRGVLTHCSSQMRSPKTADVDTLDAIPTIAPGSPPILTGNVHLPTGEQLINLPAPIAQGRPTTPDFLHRKVTRRQPAMNCSPADQKRALSHRPQQAGQTDLRAQRHNLHYQHDCTYDCFHGSLHRSLLENLTPLW